MTNLRPAWALGVLLFLGTSVLRLFAASPAQDMTTAATNFLNALNAEQRAKALVEFKSDERFDWNFIPKNRAGLPFKEMNPTQQELGRVLLRSGLSDRGYTKATNIILVIEQVLKDLEDGAARRDSGFYYVTIFGQPGPTAWGWRVEGHHLSLNFTVRGDEVLGVTPSFFGSNPAEVPRGPHQGLRVLGAEEDLGRELVRSLNEEQRKVAVFAATAPSEIITGASRKANPLQPEGIGAGDLTPKQQDALRTLIHEYVFRYRTELAEQDMKKIQDAGFEKIHFAWAGPVEPGQGGHYYRVQGPTFLLEFDNTQNNANHIHTVWRDFENDFGEDLLRKHYETVKHDR